MVFGLGGSKSELARLKQAFEALRERSELLDSFAVSGSGKPSCTTAMPCIPRACGRGRPSFAA